MTLSDKKFINGPYKGTRLEIMNSKAATKLPNGTPIVEYNYDEAELTAAQVAHRLGKIDIHEPQTYSITEKGNTTSYVGPSVAQEWKLLYQGKRPFYQTYKERRAK